MTSRPDVLSAVPASSRRDLRHAGARGTAPPGAALSGRTDPHTNRRAEAASAVALALRVAWSASKRPFLKPPLTPSVTRSCQMSRESPDYPGDICLHHHPACRLNPGLKHRPSVAQPPHSYRSLPIRGTFLPASGILSPHGGHESPRLQGSLPLVATNLPSGVIGPRSAARPPFREWLRRAVRGVAWASQSVSASR
jgi:hypothetical protein